MVSIQKLFKAKLCSIDFKICMIPKTVRSQKMPYVILKYKTKYLAQKEVRQEKSSNGSGFGWGVGVGLDIAPLIKI